MSILTQTTENQNSQGRIGPTTTSWTSQLRRYVDATSHRLCRAPTHEACKRRATDDFSTAFLEGVGQRACTVPTSATTLLSVKGQSHPVCLF